jgi:hypothetical protein
MWSRIASTSIAGLLLIHPSVSAHATVTGITFEEQSPVVGQSVTAIAIDDQKHDVVKWNWNYTLTDAGTSTSPTTIRSTVPGRATLDLLCGGTYTVSLEITYGGPMPTPPETVSVAVTIARPDALKNIGGLEVAVHYPGEAIATTIRHQVMSRESDAGEHLLGMAQRRIRNRIRWDGKKEPDQSWQPKAPGPIICQNRGVIESWVMLNISPRDWAKVPHGKPIMTWDEDVRLVYGIESAKHEGEGARHFRGKLVSVECALGTEHLSIVKLDDGRWTVRRDVGAKSSRAQSEHGAPPASKRSVQDVRGESGFRGR